MKNILLVLSSILIFVTALQSCKKDKTDTLSDNALLADVNAGSYSYYQNGNVLAAAAASPHGSFKLRFNSIAQSALDSTGELPFGNSFPTGSVIVKEVYSNGTKNLYAVMKKDPSNSNASSGWIWAEFKTDGSASFSTGKKGDGCVSCHSASPNRDHVRTFDLH